jgi:predicted membrane-bound spermidine synthase
MTAAICVVFFLSGAAALLFETLWFRLAGLVFGNSVWAASLVLGSFMGGLALGNTLAARYGPRLRHPLRFYAVLELVIGTTGLGLVLLLPSLTAVVLPLLRPFLANEAVLNGLRLSLSFALLMVPSTAMGATLPLLVKTLLDRDPDFGRTLGRLYGWNTLGAAAGAVAGEGALIAWLGLRGTGAVAAALDAVAAVVALTLARRVGAPAVAGPLTPMTRLTPAAIRLLAAAFLSGAILLALEVVWLRFLVLFLSGTSPSFAGMLAVVLLGIGVGGLAASLWSGRDPMAHRWLPGLALLAGLATAIAYVTFDRALAIVGADYSHLPGAIALMSIWLMFAVSGLSGLLFTLTGRAVRETVPEGTRATGMLTLANTTGAMIGGPIAGFILLPGLGMERSFFALASTYGVVAVLLWTGVARSVSRARWERIVAGAAAGGFAVLMALFPFGLMNRRYIGRVVQRYTGDGSRLAALREGLTETVLVTRRDVLGHPVFYRLVTNGFSMSATGMMSDRYMKLFVYWPLAVQPRIESALLISYGAGTTAHALVDTAGLKTIDIVDISRTILDTAPVLFPPPGRTPLQDPRVTVHIEDGRFFLASSTRQFDLITAEPPPPKHAGVVNLYSREYFALVRGRLSEHGVATHWLPVSELDPADSLSIIKAFCSVFEDCSLWSGMGLSWMLAGSRGGLTPVTEEEFSRQWRDPSVTSNLRAEGLESPEILGTLFIGGRAFLEELSRGAAPVTDNHPYRLSARLADVARDRPYWIALVDTAATRTRFAADDAIRRTWPPAIRERALQSFEYQRLLDAFFVGPGSDLADRLEALLGALTRTSSRALPLWFMDTHESEVRLAVGAGPVEGGPSIVEFLRAADAIARRDYAEGARRLQIVQARNPTTPRIVSLHIVALHLAGDTARASAEAAAACQGRPSPVLDAKTCAWLERTFPAPR